MKFIKSIIFAAIPWYPIGWAIHQVTNDEKPAIIGTSIISIIIFFIFMNNSKNESSVDFASRAVGAVQDLKEEIEFTLEQKSANLYAQAEEEYNDGKIDKGLWSQALIKANGDENLRKVEYMKLRVKQLKRNV